MFSRLLTVLIMVWCVASCAQLPTLTAEEQQLYLQAEKNAQQIHQVVNTCFANSSVSRQLGHQYTITGVSVGVGPSHPSTKYCSSCIDCTFGFCRAVTKCCKPHQGTQCQPCYDGN